MKNKTYPTTIPKKDDNVIIHKTSIEATLENKPYIVSACRASKYSKYDKFERKEKQRLKKELIDYYTR